MSSFELAIPIILAHEGPFVDDPQDPGGATNFGISLRFLKGLTNRHKQLISVYDADQNGVIEQQDIRQLTRNAAINIYKTYWWDCYKYSEISDQKIATKIFDLAVNMGSKVAHICLQRALRSSIGVDFPEDGKLDSKIFHTINNAHPMVLLAALRSEAAGYYRSLKKPRFEKGWLRRAYS